MGDGGRLALADAADLNRHYGTLKNCAGVAELADAPGLKSGGRKAVKVQFLSPALTTQ
jgi:hypothetical protein